MNVTSGGYSNQLAIYGLGDIRNEESLKKIEGIAKDYSNTKIREELVTALKENDEEKLAEISANLPNIQESNLYKKYLEEKGETIAEDKKFKFLTNTHENIGIDNKLWFTHQLAMLDTYDQKNIDSNINHTAGAMSSVNIMIIAMETNPDSINVSQDMFKTQIDSSLAEQILDQLSNIQGSENKDKKKESFQANRTTTKISSDNSSENQEKSNSVKEPKSLNQVFDERLEFFSADDKTIETRMGSTEETAQEHQKRLERHKYMYQKNIEYLNTFKDYLLKFDIMQPKEIESDRLLDVKV